MLIEKAIVVVPGRAREQLTCFRFAIVADQNRRLEVDEFFAGTDSLDGIAIESGAILSTNEAIGHLLRGGIGEVVSRCSPPSEELLNGLLGFLRDLSL